MFHADGQTEGRDEDNSHFSQVLQRNLIMLYAFFWVITRRLEFICRRFGTLCLFHLHRQVPAYEDGTDSVPKRRYINSRRRVITQKKVIQHTEHGESFKSRA